MAAQTVRSDVAGKVWKVVAKPGDRVAAEDTLVIIESMKMEIPVIADDGGTVTEFRVTEGQSVTEGQVVAVIEE